MFVSLPILHTHDIHIHMQHATVRVRRSLRVTFGFFHMCVYGTSDVNTECGSHGDRPIELSDCCIINEFEPDVSGHIPYKVHYII